MTTVARFVDGLKARLKENKAKFVENKSFDYRASPPTWDYEEVEAIDFEALLREIDEFSKGFES